MNIFLIENLSVFIHYITGFDSLRAGQSGDRIPVGGAKFSAPVQTGPGAHSATDTIGSGCFPGVKRPGLGVDHPPLPVPRSKKE